MKAKKIVLLTSLMFIWATIALAEVPSTTGVISNVTVYHGQALVTRTIDVELPPGTSELIVQNLPNKIIPESLYAQTTNNCEVLSVRYREKAVRKDTREEVKQLDAQINDVQNKLYQNQRDQDITVWLFGHFKGQWQLSIDSANANLNRGVLESETIEKLTKYLEEKAVQWHEKKVELEFHKKELEKQLELLERKRKQLDAGISHTERQAILFVKKNDKKKSSIELSYLVNGANWRPQYNLRANQDKSNTLIEYNAVVNQTSGEDWNKVSISLSTAEPSMVAAAPVLRPMFVGLSNPSAQQQAGAFVPFAKAKDLTKSRKANIRKGMAANQELNTIAADMQSFFLQASEKELQRFQEKLVEIARVEGISVTYDLPGKLTLPSRSDQQLVTIASVNTKADFTLVATPLLTDYVYLQAELLNDSEIVFLPGPASMFRNGEFVGKSNLPIVTIGEKFTAGFGIDSQVQVTQELEDKKTRIQGGNRIDTYHYRIVINNYKDTASELRLLDRLPHTEDNSIKIELLETKPDLSMDSEYLRTLRKKGILRWDLNLTPNSIDQNATIIEYSFTTEYDKNMQIQPRNPEK